MLRDLICTVLSTTSGHYPNVKKGTLALAQIPSVVDHCVCITGFRSRHRTFKDKPNSKPHHCREENRAGRAGCGRAHEQGQAWLLPPTDRTAERAYKQEVDGKDGNRFDCAPFGIEEDEGGVRAYAPEYEGPQGVAFEESRPFISV